jgi:hypothetical protein
MIKDSTFVGCENLPADMAKCLDLPWNDLGEVSASIVRRAYLEKACSKCSAKPCVAYTDEPIVQPPSFAIVHMPGRMFVTDDMIEVVVFFGQCHKCKAVYWARSGPPFKRARAFMPAETS